MINFVTFFDSGYLSRGYLLLKSLQQHTTKFRFYIIALDKKVYSYFSQFRNVIVISVEELENYYPDLIRLKGERSRVEYIFTMSPFVPSFVLEKYKELDHIISLDADQYFFSSPTSILELLENHSVLITPHRFQGNLIELEKYGRYNVSFQVFKNDEIGKACLSYWMQQCTEWCCDKLEENRFADQKYLDFWSAKFGKSVKEIDHIGFGLAPWNIDNYTIKVKNADVFVNNVPLVLFHYQGLRVIENGLVNSGFAAYQAKVTKKIKNKILFPIINGLLSFDQQKMDSGITRLNSSSNANTLFRRIDREGLLWFKNTYLIDLSFIVQLKKIVKNGYGKFIGFKNIYR